MGQMKSISCRFLAVNVHRPISRLGNFDNNGENSAPGFCGGFGLPAFCDSAAIKGTISSKDIPSAEESVSIACLSLAAKHRYRGLR